MDSESYASAATPTGPDGQLKGKGKVKPAYTGKGIGREKG
jgi:hypothetical protein